MMNGIPILVLTLLILYCIKRLLAFRDAVSSIQNLPGYRTLFSPYSVLGFILPPLPGLNVGNNRFFCDKHTTFKTAGWDMTSHVSALPKVVTVISLADADTIKEVTASRARFPKPVDQYKLLTFLGGNIVASEGDEWKKYRKIVAPAFSDRNNKLVWDETVQIMNSLFKDVWRDKDVISVDHGAEITTSIALFVIGAAGFGKKMSWLDDSIPPGSGHQMTFKDSLRIASADIIWKISAPTWALGLTAGLQSVKIAFDELEAYMLEMIKGRLESEKVERHDLFSSLLEANNDDPETARLNDNELMSNIYIFLLAGHETTAHTLCFALALLAFDQEEQENIFEHVKSILPDGGLPTYEQMPLLTYSEAVINESLRLFPPVVIIPKINLEDTVLSVGNANGEKRTVTVPKGTHININAPALHYNPRYWDKPECFKPSRFLKSNWPRDAFIPFGTGVRACLGRKFAETESIAVLTMLVSRYKISIKEEPQFATETTEQRKERVFRTINILTLTPVRVPLTFTRRTA